MGLRKGALDRSDSNKKKKNRTTRREKIEKRSFRVKKKRRNGDLAFPSRGEEKVHRN